MIGEVGQQATQLVVTKYLGEANEQAKKDPKYAQSKEYKELQAKWGAGSDFQRGMQAATAALQGLAGGDIAQAAAGAAAPYLAQLIKQQTPEGPSRVMAHALVQGALAAAQNKNAMVSATGAATGELVGMLATELYHKEASQLTEGEKETVSTLATLAAGLAGGLTGADGSDVLAGAQTGKTVVENNWLSETESRQFDKELSDCKKSGGDCSRVIEKYIDKSNENSINLANSCTGGGLTCVSWEELIQANTNVAMDADPQQIRLSEKLKDPDAVAIVKYLNGTDLKFLKDNITTGDRVMDVVLTPTSWPVALMGGKAIITNAVKNTKEQLIAVGVAGSANAGIQYGVTGEVKLSDVLGSVIVGGITAGKGYNPTVSWNAAGGYCQAEISGDDPVMSALLSTTSSGLGYRTGNLLKIPFDKVLNPVSKQYEWVSSGVWTISKPVPQNSIPSVSGNVFDSLTSGSLNPPKSNAPGDE